MKDITMTIFYEPYTLKLVSLTEVPQNIQPSKIE